MKLAHRLIWMVLILTSQAWASAPILDRIDGGTLHFKDQKPVHTQLKDIKYLGSIGTKEGSAFHVLTGRNCSDCAEERAVYLVRPEGGKPVQLVEPGRIVDPKSQTVLMDSRAYFGNCIPGAPETYVVYQKERVEKKRHGRRYTSTEPSIFVAQPHKDGLFEKLHEVRSLSNLDARERQTLKLVKVKQCTAIEPRHRQMLAKPLDLTPRDSGDDADDEDEAEQKPKTPEESEGP